MPKKPPNLPGPRAIIVLRLDVRFVLQQQLHAGAVASPRCFMQGGVASERRGTVSPQGVA